METTTTPSVRPSNAPITTSQSNKPSATPSSMADMPTMTPTKRPVLDEVETKHPSSIPSIRKTEIPTIAPSMGPSDQ
eukprot:10420994-Ditylum_brightwellii.AAC.1